MPFAPGRPRKPLEDRDAVPVDAGCPEVAPRCQECPLDRCKYDDWRAYRRWKRAPDLVALVTRYPGSISRLEAETEALRLGVTPRTIFRRLARQREE